MSRDSSSDGSAEDGEKGAAGCQEEDSFKDISMYFSKKQWMELRDWEKVRFKNVKRNYEAMIKIGLTASRPTFMCRGKQNRRAKVEESGDSDEEWMPKQLVKASRFSSRLKQKTHLRNKEMTKELTDAKMKGTVDLSEELKIVVMNNVTNSEEVKKQECRKKDAAVHIYNLRERKYPIYQEIWDPQDDDYLFCEECQTFFLETCAVHGPPKFVQDGAMIKGYPYCSAITLPPGLRIGLSGIPNAGLGVWNEGSNLPMGLHFGPYEGKSTEDDEAANSGYSWMITKGRNSYEYVDGKEESCSNWMRYVNCAREEEEQNLVAFQYQRQIFYRTCRVIRPGCELLVWYGDEYGQELGIKWGRKWKRPLTGITDFSTHAFLSQQVPKQPSQGFLDSTTGSHGLGNLHPDQLLPPGYSCVSDKAETSRKEHPSTLWEKIKKVDLEEPASLPQRQHVREEESNLGEWDLSRIQGESVKLTSLALQEESQEGLGQYKCGEGKQRYSSKPGLIRHRQRTHSGEKCYVCEECKRGFARRSYLNIHRRRHSGQKPHVCEECKRGFADKSTLIRHRWTHSKEKPYICEECKQGFTQKSYLIKHRWKHLGEKPYVCKECKQRFTQRSYLNTHRWRHRQRSLLCMRSAGEDLHRDHSSSYTDGHTQERGLMCVRSVREDLHRDHTSTHTDGNVGKEEPYVCEECR
ncbi:histone-lysine N-methyltransferase PRDM9-like isoform 1-T1 [Sarcophilus harrisii]